MEELLLISNEWWTEKSISEEKAKEYKRKIFSSIEDIFFNYKQITILTGLRRVGKTTLMYQLIKELLERGINPKKILYFSFDEKVEEPLRIMKEYEKITKVDWRREKVYVFFDEVHKLPGWSSKIKILYDQLPNLKICLSGSASIMIEAEAAKNLAGRYFLREVTPLSLKEFAELYLGKEIKNFELWRSRLEAMFEDYVRKPFPEIVKWDDRKKINEYIRELVIEKIVKSDIPSIVERVNLRLLSSLTDVFLREVVSILDVSSLSKDFGVHKSTLEKHIHFLEFGKVIRIVKNFRPSVRAESRKLKKVYPFHVALSFPYYPRVNEGKILESLVLSSLNLDKYWRMRGKEIDFLKLNEEILPIEVKAKESINRKDLRNLVYFMEKYDTKGGMIVYKGKRKTLRIKEREITLLPMTEVVFDVDTYE